MAPSIQHFLSRMRAGFARILGRMRAARERREARNDTGIEDLLARHDLDDRAALAALAKSYVLHMRQERRRELRWQKIRRGIIVLIMVSGVLAFWYQALLQAQIDLRFWEAPRNEVAVVEMRGVIASGGTVTADRTVAALRSALNNERVGKIILFIDSPGGSPAEAERIATMVRQAREQHEQPIVAVSGGSLASAAYLIAIEADTIVVPGYAMVGSVGAAINGWDFSGLLRRLDVERRSYASGQYKSMLDPFAPTPEHAQKRAQAMVDAVGRRFVKQVQQRRPQIGMTPSEIGSGAVWLGFDAVRLGLADQEGTLESVLASHRERYPNVRVRHINIARESGLSQWLGTMLANTN